MEGMLLWVGDDTGFREAAGDKATRALTTISYPHHEIHAGSGYNVHASKDMTINHCLDVQFTTPNAEKWIHLNYLFSVESQTNYWIYESAVIVSVGTVAVTAYNRDRNSPNISPVTVNVVTNATLADATADTQTAAATVLVPGMTGIRNAGGGHSTRHEWILKQNTIYCMRAEAIAAGWIDFDLDWYEHENQS